MTDKISWHARWGPVAVWGVFFAVGALLRALAFDDDTVWLSLPPDATLWTVGLLIAEVIAQQASAGGALRPEYTWQKDGYDVRFKLAFAGDPRESPWRLYLTFYAVGAWISSLLLTEYGLRSLAKDGISFVSVFVLALAHLIAIAIVWQSITAVMPRAGGGAIETTSTAAASSATTAPTEELRTS